MLQRSYGVRAVQDTEHRITCTIPIFEPISTQYFVKLVAMDWLYAEAQVELNLQDVVLPLSAGSHTDLLDLTPLPRAALRNKEFEKLYEGRFSHFNPIQTQAFHVLHHTDDSVLLGAPTGALLRICCSDCKEGRSGSAHRQKVPKHSSHNDGVRSWHASGMTEQLRTCCSACCMAEGRRMTLCMSDHITSCTCCCAELLVNTSATSTAWLRLAVCAHGRLCMHLAFRL